VRGFFDPSVKFGLQFDVVPAEGKSVQVASERNQPAEPDEPRRQAGGSVPKIKPKSADKKEDGKEKTEKSGKAGKKEEADDDATKVVSLDTFRKKK
jgi:hypothetical protein